MNDTRATPSLTLTRIQQAGVDFDGFYRLFTTLIPEKNRFDKQDILRWIVLANPKHDAYQLDWEAFLYALKAGQQVVGFIYFEYYWKKGLLFIGWMGMDNSHIQARLNTANTFLAALKELATKHQVKFEAIIIEIEKTDSHFDAAENLKRAALGQLIQGYIGQAGWTAYEVDAAYVQPVPSDQDTESYLEEDMRLVYVPLNAVENLDHLTKEKASAILEFLYLDIYADETEPDTHERDMEKQYMRHMLDKHIRKLPEHVTLKKI